MERDDTDRTVEALCRLPIDFHALGHVSAVDLVVRSGYPAFASQVTADRARRCLADHPDWVDAWFGWSDDQRSSPAWWLAERSATTYEVGYLEPGRELQQPPLVFEDRVQACAEFMVRAVAAIEASRLRVEAIRMPGESYLDAAVRHTATGVHRRAELDELRDKSD